MRHTKPISVGKLTQLPASAAAIGDFFSKVDCFVGALRGDNPEICKRDRGLKGDE